MISNIGYNNASNVNFKGVTKIKAVLFDGEITDEKKVVDSAIKISKKVFTNNITTPQHLEYTQKLRRNFRFFDRDYQIPLRPLDGNSRRVFSHVCTQGQHYFITGKDAEAIELAGYQIGHTKLALKEARETPYEKARLLDYLEAKSNYGRVMSRIQSKYRNSNHPEIVIYTKKINSKKIGVTKIELGDDTHKITLQPKSATTNQTAVSQTTGQVTANPTKTSIAAKPVQPVKKESKPVQSDFLKELFEKK